MARSGRLLRSTRGFFGRFVPANCLKAFRRGTRRTSPCRSAEPIPLMLRENALWLKLRQRSRFAAFAASGVLCSFGLSSLRADTFPALNASPSNEQHAGKFEWADVFVDHASGEANFYSNLFHWTATPLQRHGRPVIVLSDGAQPVATIVERPAAKQNPGTARWIGYAAVADLPAAIADVEKNGGKVLVKNRKIPDRGDLAVVADREGAVFGLIHSTSGDVPDYQPSPGEIAWAELFSTDPKSAAGFYEAVFHYSGVVDEGHEDQSHYYLADGELARAGVAPTPPWEGGHPDWLVFFCVADVEAAAQQAQSLGGNVVVKPHASRHGGKVAVIEDPEGATFGLLEVETATKLKEAP